MSTTKLYTRCGDAGTTSLVGGERVAKTDGRLEAYGTIDELNAHIGLLVAQTADAEQQAVMRAVQHDLFYLGALLATPPAARTEATRGVGPERVAAMERAIDRLQACVPTVRAFVLPGGCPAAAQAHVCRTVCRRAERRILALPPAQRPEPQALAFINRLSDYFFVLARYFNFLTGKEEIVSFK